MYPDKEAGACRVLGIGQALRAGGFNVFFAWTEEAGRLEDRQHDGTFGYQGFRHVLEATGTVLQKKAVFGNGLISISR